MSNLNLRNGNWKTLGLLGLMLWVVASPVAAQCSSQKGVVSRHAVSLRSLTVVAARPVAPAANPGNKSEAPLAAPAPAPEAVPAATAVPAPAPAPEAATVIPAVANRPAVGVNAGAAGSRGETEAPPALPPQSELPPLPSAEAVGTRPDTAGTRSVGNGSTNPASSSAAANAPAGPSARTPELLMGATVTIKSRLLGSTVGQISIRVGDQVVPSEVVRWMDHEVTFVVPEMDLEADAEGSIEISRSNGRVFRKVAVRVKADVAEIVVNDGRIASSNLGN